MLTDFVVGPTKEYDIPRGVRPKRIVYWSRGATPTPHLAGIVAPLDDPYYEYEVYYNTMDKNYEVVRYEGTQDRLHRALEKAHVNERFPHGFDVTILKSILFGGYIKDAATFKTVNKNLTPKDQERCRRLFERFPDLTIECPSVYLNGKALEATYYTSGEAQEYHITPAPSMGAMAIQGTGIFQYPVLFVQGETVLGNSDRYETDYLLTDARETLDKVEQFLTVIVDTEKATNNSGRKINVYGSDSPIELNEASHAKWEDVFLSEEVTRSIKDDIYFFLENEKVFREVGIPYKRGYLLTGPPGNGKSSIARVLATSMPFESFMFDFSNPDMGNSELTEAFKWATAKAPSVFFLEDIDRIFDPDTGPKTRVTMDHLLNCLDGIKVNDGLVVVATANNPKVLDSAILSRPGRFDKVVQIDVPDHKLRERYLGHLFRKLPSITAKDVTYMADETEGVSMAFLKEVFVVTASRAIMVGETPSRKHVDDALTEILKQYGGVCKSNARKAGFGS